MKKFCSAMVALGVLALSQQGFAQSSTEVSYDCLGGDKVNVQYSFNAQGVPTSASVKLHGKQRKLPYDLNRSYNEETYFTDAKGYQIGSEYFDVNNVGDVSVLIMGPGDDILHKSCMPKKVRGAKKGGGAVDAAKVTKRGSVQYVCQNDRRLKVDYAFNEAGVPVQAALKIKGKNRTLRYDMDYSNDVDVRFADKNYSLDTGYMDAGNFRDQSVMVMNNKDEILYKSCEPLR